VHGHDLRPSHCVMLGRLLPVPSVASGGSITARGMCQNTSPGDHIKPSRLLQCAALRHQRQYTFRRLQSIQKVATNFLTGVADATKSHSVLRSLHWLKQRVHYKLATLVYKSLRGQAPSYLVDDCKLIADSGRS